jgi:sporulation protein YlmC with PRC-barrel domain
MRFKEDMRVLSAQGDDVGQLEQVVVDPQTKEVSHIVVRKGWLFTEDKLVPLNLIASTDENSITLREDAGVLHDLPVFEETHYIPLDELERGERDYPNTPALYWMPPMGGFMGAPIGVPVAPPSVPKTESNAPEGTVALREEAEVYSSDDELVGHVDSIMIDDSTERLSYFVLSYGVPSIKRIVPMSWVRDIYEDRIVLTVGHSMIDRLREYHPEA